jgi:hypothetical protein
MLLSARMLNGYADINTFDYAQVHQMTKGEQSAVYFQLVDISKNPSTQYFFPSGLRYAPQAGATLQCVLASIDNAKGVTRYAAQASPTLDASIWKLTILPTDQIAGTYALQLTLTEGAMVRKGVLQQALQVIDTSASFC